MNDRNELQQIRRREAEDRAALEHVLAPPAEGNRIYLGKVKRDDRFWPYLIRALPLGGFASAPGPPYEAMTRPLDFDPFDLGDAPDPSVDETDLVPVVCVNEAPINDTQLIARNSNGQWMTDDAFGGYFNITVLPFCTGVDVSAATVTVLDLASPGESQTGTWDGTGTPYQLATLFFDPPPTGGTFTYANIYNPSLHTDPIAWNATAADVQAALTAFGLTVTCIDGPLPGTPILLKYTGALAVAPNVTGLVGGRHAILQINIGPYIHGGTFTLKMFSGLPAEQTTVALPWNATNDQVQAAVETFTWVGRGNVLVTNSAPGLAYGGWCLEFVGWSAAQASSFLGFIQVDSTNLIGYQSENIIDNAPGVVIRSVQAAASPTWTVVTGTVLAELNPSSRFNPETAVLVFPFRTRGPFRITATGSFADFSQDVLPPAGLVRLPLSVGYIEGKICTCFGQVDPAFTISTPFGTFDLTPQQFDSGTGVYSEWTSTSGYPLVAWAADVVVTASGYADKIPNDPTSGYVGSGETATGSTRLYILFICGQPPQLLIQFLLTAQSVPDAYGHYSLVWGFLIWSHYQTDYCPGGPSTGPFMCVTAPSLLPIYPYDIDISYLGSVPVALPVIASFTVGSTITTTTFPITFSGLAGTWTVNES